MSNLQVRNVPTELHRVLKAKAAIEGLSLSDFLLPELEKLARRPTPRELRERLHRRSEVHSNPPAADVIRDQRDRD